VVVLKDLVQPRDLVAAGAGGATISWQFAQPGLLTYAPERDEWIHERAKRSDARRPVFNSGLLVPGETITVRAKVRLLEMPLDFRFSYFELGAEDVRRKVYWEQRQDKESRYRLMVGKDLDLRLTPEPKTDSSGHRIVLFPHADPVRATATLLKTVRVDEGLEPRAFDLDAALARAGVKARPLPGQFTFSTALDAWILPKDGGHVRASAEGVTPLPKLENPDGIFYHVDGVSPRKLEVELKGDAVALAMKDLKYALVAQEKQVRIGPGVVETRKHWHLFVTPQELPRLLDDARSLKFTLGVEYGADAAGRLTLDYR
jgi:hypothetical protein